jgi:hypothetical protein
MFNLFPVVGIFPVPRPIAYDVFAPVTVEVYALDVFTVLPIPLNLAPLHIV